MAPNRRIRSSGVDDIAEASHQMMDAMQTPVAAQLRTAITPVRVLTVEDFLCHKPMEFTGKVSPDEADAWPRKCEMIFGSWKNISLTQPGRTWKLSSLHCSKGI